MKNLKIALAFSGGGYRAASFSLGTLSYLNRLQVNDQSLLSHVVALSTVSGGTITGAAYAVGVKRGEDFNTIYSTIYEFMKKTDIVEGSLERLLSNEGWGDERIKSLINAFADVYHEGLFKKADFGLLMNQQPEIHLKNICFNATEFCNALQFRFQWSESLKNPQRDEPARGIIGNNYYRVPEEAAREIRIADILAASSCFPGGFEPINFPTDFIQETSVNLKRLSSQQNYPVGLMDGGIVDNQGIDSILLAEKRMKRNREVERDENELDLIIVADVASPYMESYKASVEQPAKGWRKLTPALFLIINSIVLALAGFGVYWFLKNRNDAMLILSTVMLTLTTVVFVIGRFLKNLPLKFEVPPHFLEPLGKLLNLKLQVYETLLINRKNSVLKLVSEVFLKHVRRLNYNSVYTDKSWKNRRIMNAIYELRNGERLLHEKIQKESLPGYLMPSPDVQKVAELAASMGTTLWFTPDELQKKNMFNAIVACGQFTTCWNLLEYIETASADKSNTNENHQLIFALKEKLKADWDSFNRNPYWFVDRMNDDLKLK